MQKGNTLPQPGTVQLPGQAGLAADTILQHMPVALVAVDTDYRVVKFSQTWFDLMCKVNNSPLDATDLLHCDYRQELELLMPLEHEWLRVMQGQAAEPWIVQVHQHECEEHWVNVECAAVYDDHGVVCGAIATFCDVTAMSKPEQLLRMANEELIQFNYHVSHDLVAPIASARGLINLIQSDLEAGEQDEVPEMLNEAAEQLTRLDRLVIDLMALAKADARTNEITAFDLSQLVDEIAASLALGSRDSAVSITPRLEQAELIADRVRVQQILTNLLSNAKKFVDSAEAEPDITVRSYQQDASTVIEVSDNGLGIDSKLAKKLFGIFSKGSSKHSGHGLGLYIVLKHTHHLGGTIAVTSYAKPTVFELRLPQLTLS